MLFLLQLLISAIVALAASHPVDYDDLGVGVNLPESSASGKTNDGSKYDPGLFDRYSDDTRELVYVEPVAGELPFKGLREKRDLAANNGHAGAFGSNIDLFASLHDYIRPERDTDSNETDIKVPLHGIVHAIETTLLNSAGNIKSAPNDTQATPAAPAHDSDEEERKERSIETESSAKTDDVDEYLDKDLKLDVADVEEPRAQNLGILSPIAFGPSIRDREASATSTTTESASAEATDAAVEPEGKFHQTNITVIKSTNSTHFIPAGDAIHVQHQHIQQSIFHSNLAILPTIAPSQVDVPLPSRTVGSSSAEDSFEATSDCGSSSEESGEGKTKCEKLEATTVARDTLKDELVKKAQKLKEQVAEVAAEPVILSQGI